MLLLYNLFIWSHTMEICNNTHTKKWIFQDCASGIFDAMEQEYYFCIRIGQFLWLCKVLFSVVPSQWGILINSVLVFQGLFFSASLVMKSLQARAICLPIHEFTKTSCLIKVDCFAQIHDNSRNYLSIREKKITQDHRDNVI